MIVPLLADWVTMLENNISVFSLEKCMPRQLSLMQFAASRDFT